MVMFKPILKILHMQKNSAKGLCAIGHFFPGLVYPSYQVDYFQSKTGPRPGSKTRQKQMKPCKV